MGCVPSKFHRNPPDEMPLSPCTLTLALTRRSAARCAASSVLPHIQKAVKDTFAGANKTRRSRSLCRTSHPAQPPQSDREAPLRHHSAPGGRKWRAGDLRAEAQRPHFVHRPDGRPDRSHRDRCARKHNRKLRCIPGAANKSHRNDSAHRFPEENAARAPQRRARDPARSPRHPARPTGAHRAPPHSQAPKRGPGSFPAREIRPAEAQVYPCPMECPRSGKLGSSRAASLYPDTKVARHPTAHVNPTTAASFRT